MPPADASVNHKAPPLSTRFGEWFNPKPRWQRAALIVGVAIAAVAVAVLWSLGNENGSDNDGTIRSLSVTVKKCAMKAGKFEAGGYVLNGGNGVETVTVNLYLAGLYAGNDVVTVRPGEQAVWEVDTPIVSSGSCTAEVGEP
jgi:hypothetical protein